MLSVFIKHNTHKHTHSQRETLRGVWYALYLNIGKRYVVIVWLCSHVRFFVTPWIAAHQAPYPLPSKELAQIHVHFINNAIQPSHPLMPYFPSALIFSSFRTFPMSFLCASHDKNSGASVSVSSFFPVNIQCWSPLRLTDLIPLCQRDVQESSLAPQFKGINSLDFCFHYGLALITVLDHWEDCSLDCMTFAHRVTSLLFHTLSRFVISFLPTGNHLLILWLQSWA